MQSEILKYINANTHRERLDELSTNQVAEKFSLSTKLAYDILCSLAAKGEITKLDPVNGNKFDCCGWIRNND